MRHKNTSEILPKRLKIELHIAWAGAMILGASLDVAAISPKTAEYPALAGGGVFLAGVIAGAIDIYKLRGFYDYSPDDDPEREDIDTMGEVVKFPQYEPLMMPQEEAA